MDAKSTVIRSQRKIIDELAGCEARIGLLYEQYATRFPDMEPHWRGLAEDEMTHSALLKTMHRILDKGSLFFDLGKFSSGALPAINALLDRAMERAKTRSFAPDEALSTAFEIETSLIDSHFYDVVTSDAPEFRIIAARLSKDTKEHAASIRDDFKASKTSTRPPLGPKG
jgi:hypothetical protein